MMRVSLRMSRNGSGKPSFAAKAEPGKGQIGYGLHVSICLKNTKAEAERGLSEQSDGLMQKLAREIACALLHEQSGFTCRDDWKNSHK
ncbi:hypothetical protein DUNSADRAFT_10191 [Dunaliella salina]|uniref:Encoded protein n=1 Tax=Dunaliella salina TaxID=3046 RepID=A0ABQ7GFX6_DUNSA|nr:hypothetical protein DUNSADRAFT_10191 [Dunaliella salina]|eukprot:KAF5833504.1 hypothetical protein DUNSADRAFT_10191 [Dunaliella salina]